MSWWMFVHWSRKVRSILVAYRDSFSIGIFDGLGFRYSIFQRILFVPMCQICSLQMVVTIYVDPLVLL